MDDRDDTAVQADETSTELAPVDRVVDLGAIDPTPALETAAKVVQHMAAQCTGPKYVATIKGRKYPKVEWWTTVGMALGLFPVEQTNRRHDRDDGTYYYEAVVEVQRGGQVVTRASGICGTDERTWSTRDEYAVRSMAATRAIGKAYRIGLSALAVMAQLDPTPAEEMPHGDARSPRRAESAAPDIQPPDKRAESEGANIQSTARAHYAQRIKRIGDQGYLTVDDRRELRAAFEAASSTGEWHQVAESAVARNERRKAEQAGDGPGESPI